jgi:hypothetical protein
MRMGLWLASSGVSGEFADDVLASELRLVKSKLDLVQIRVLGS